MFWKSTEQYPDFTAAEAMLRTPAYCPEDLDALDTGGCVRLVCAVIRQALSDRSRAERNLPSPAAKARIREIDSFFRSDYFRCLTAAGGESFLDLVRKEMIG